MVVHNFCVCWSRIRPAKTDAVLIIHAHTVLSLPIPLEGFQSIAWGNVEFLEGSYGVKLIKFAGGDLPQGLWAGASGSFGPLPVENILRTCGLE